MKRKGILQFIKNCLIDYESNLNVKHIIRQMHEILSIMRLHYELNDLEKNSNHELRFCLLYVDENNLTFSKMSEATYVGYDTFKAYVKAYNRTALDFIIKRSHQNEAYAVILQQFYASGL